MRRKPLGPAPRCHHQAVILFPSSPPASTHLAAAAQISASEATTRAVRRHEPCELRRAARAVRSQRRAAANESMMTRFPCSRYSDCNLSGRRRRGRSLFITVQHCSITVHQVLFTTVHHCSDRSGPFTVKMDGSDRVQSLSCSRSSDCRRSPSVSAPGVHGWLVQWQWQQYRHSTGLFVLASE